jgi:hypothetical protein
VQFYAILMELFRFENQASSLLLEGDVNPQAFPQKIKTKGR